MIKRPSRNHLFILIALVLISCFVFTYAASAALSFADQTHLKETPTPLPETPSVDDIGTSIQQENNTLITEEEALSLAMPAIEQFAQENGLTVKSVNASLAEVKDLNGLRGGSTLGQVLHRTSPGPKPKTNLPLSPHGK